MTKLALIAAPLLLLAACERVDRPMRPVPEAVFDAVHLDGTPVTPELFKGKPWVVNLWVPG